MAAYFGGSSGSRRPLRDEQILELLGTGDISDIEDFDEDIEESPNSLFEWLDNDSPESNDITEQLEAEQLFFESNSLSNSSDLEAPALSERFEPQDISDSNLNNNPILARSPRENAKPKKGNKNRSKSTPASMPCTSRSNTSASPTTTSKTSTKGNNSNKTRSKSTSSKNRTASTNTTAGIGNVRRQTGLPWKLTQFQTKPHEYTPTRPVRDSIEYFNEYMDDKFFEEISYCTNMYYLRKHGKELKTTRAEIMQLFGIHILMGCIPYPRLKMYWRQGISLEKITSIMSRDRFAVLRNALHVVDSDTAPPGKGNCLWKVQPMIDQIRKGCNKQERVPGFYSVDEQMIPFTGRCALRQVVKNKPRPVGLKNFVLTTSDGLMLDFDIYKGAKTMFGSDMSLGLGPSVVLHLSRSVPRGSCLYHDRYFTTIPLVEELNKRGLHSTGTIMVNRIPDRSSLKFKDDSAMQRGESQQMVRDPVALVKWKDNKSVFLVSNCSGTDNNSVVKRWEKKTRSYVNVTAPEIVMNYNKHMGGVDILDQQMEYYRTFIKTKKWTLKVLIHFLDLALVNAWRAYKKDCDAMGHPRCKILDLLEFRLEIFETIVKAPRKRRSEACFSDVSDDEIPVRPRKYQRARRPPASIIFDGYDHLPEFDDIKSPRACQLETCTSRTSTRCIKCNVYLCITRQQNCLKYSTLSDLIDANFD